MARAQTKYSTVINVKKSELPLEYDNLLEWLKDDSHVYIGRNMSFYVDGAFASKWANPFRVKKAEKTYKNGKYYTLTESLRLYEDHIRNTPKLWNALPELRGKTLGCWCKPNDCHGDILIRLLLEFDHLEKIQN